MKNNKYFLAIHHQSNGIQILVVGELVISSLLDNNLIEVVNSWEKVTHLIEDIETNFIAYLPRKVFYYERLPEIKTFEFNVLIPWLPFTTLPLETSKEMPQDAVGWIASTSIAKFVLPKLGNLDNWTILKVAEVLEINRVPFRWGAVCASKDIPGYERNEVVPISVNSTVLAVIPHYCCEIWLRRCLASLVNQTRSPDKIVVVDDGSGNPPISIVEQFPRVTLLASSLNVGPYRLIQQVIEDTNYHAYLFQDADDWSSCDRLEKLLSAAAATGAELVGTQEVRVFEEGFRLTPVCYPLDVNAALVEKPGHPLLHPSSLVARDLVMRLGGFATGLRFGGDTEFLLRAALIAKVINIPYYCYFRRKRIGSLTTADDTGLSSPARLELLKILKNRALANYAAIKQQKSPQLSPLAQQSPIKLEYVAGAKL